MELCMRLVSSGVNAFMSSGHAHGELHLLGLQLLRAETLHELGQVDRNCCGHGYLTSSSQWWGRVPNARRGVHLATFIHSPPSMLTRLPTGTSNMPGLSAPSGYHEALRAVAQGVLAHEPRRDGLEAHAAHLDGLLELAAVAALPGHLDGHGGGPRRARHPHHLVPPMPA